MKLKPENQAASLIYLITAQKFQYAAWFQIEGQVLIASLSYHLHAKVKKTFQEETVFVFRFVL